MSILVCDRVRPRTRLETWARWRMRIGAAALACISTVGVASELPAAEPLDWRQANEAVGRYLRGHADWLKAEPAPATPTRDQRAELSLDEALARSLSRRPDLFARPGQSAAEAAEQRRVALEWQREVREAWGQAVLANQLARLSEEAAHAAATGAELGRRMAQVGTWSRAQWLAEHTQSLDAHMARDNAVIAATAARAELWQRLGAPDGDARWRLPSDWPTAGLLQAMSAASAQATPPDALLEQAVARRPALQAAHLEAQRLAQAVTPQQMETMQSQLAQIAQATVARGETTAPLNPVALGWTHAQERAMNAQLALQAQQTALRLDLLLALRQRDTALNHLNRLNTWHAAQTELLDDMQRRYNGMLKSTWDLLASVREHLAAQQRLQQARHDLWLSHTRLQHLLAGGDAVPHSPNPSAAAAGAASRSPGH